MAVFSGIRIEINLKNDYLENVRSQKKKDYFPLKEVLLLSITF